jgi:hypothetical protein
VILAREIDICSDADKVGPPDKTRRPSLQELFERESSLRLRNISGRISGRSSLPQLSTPHESAPNVKSEDPWENVRHKFGFSEDIESSDAGMMRLLYHHVRCIREERGHGNNVALLHSLKMLGEDFQRGIRVCGFEKIFLDTMMDAVLKHRKENIMANQAIDANHINNVKYDVEAVVDVIPANTEDKVAKDAWFALLDILDKSQDPTKATFSTSLGSRRPFKVKNMADSLRSGLACSKRSLSASSLVSESQWNEPVGVSS